MRPTESHFRMILKIILKKKGIERQASSSKLRLTAGVGYDRIYLERNNYGHNTIEKNSGCIGRDPETS